MPEDPRQPGSSDQSPSVGSRPGGTSIPGSAPAGGQPAGRQVSQRASQSESQADSSAETASSRETQSDSGPSTGGPGRPASEADFTFVAGDLDAEDLKVTAFSGTEEISRLFSFSRRAVLGRGRHRV